MVFVIAVSRESITEICWRHRAAGDIGPVAIACSRAVEQRNGCSKCQNVKSIHLTIFRRHNRLYNIINSRWL